MEFADACINGEWEQALQLSEHIDEINERVLIGYIYACEHGILDIVRKLLPRIPTEGFYAVNKSVFVKACLNDNFDLVELLLGRGCIDSPTIIKGFRMVCISGSVETADLLCRYHTHDYRPFFPSAITFDRAEIVRIFFEYYHLSQEDIDEYFLQACRENHPDIVRFLSLKVNDSVIRQNFDILNSNSHIVIFETFLPRLTIKEISQMRLCFNSLCTFRRIDAIKLFRDEDIVSLGHEALSYACFDIETSRVLLSKLSIVTIREKDDEILRTGRKRLEFYELILKRFEEEGISYIDKEFIAEAEAYRNREYAQMLKDFNSTAGKLLLPVK